ncbi:MAG: hypothetical protein KJ604_20770 [Gammaproteobacteria bacterium]|nr:hypothetical protein [Gammaproteobacteria bacterium]
MTDAWSYTLSAVDRGMTATAGLADYRDGGGVIRTADWYSLTALAREARDAGDLVQGLPFETPIPGQAYATVDLDYGQKYVVTADVNYVDQATGEIVRRTVTVENDEQRSWIDIEHQIEDVVAGYGVQGGTAGIAIERTHFYQARWIEW